MKIRSNIFLCLFVLLSVAGCNDYLEEVNHADVVADEYYATKEGYESLVNATYASLRTVFGNEPWLFSAGTDLYVEGRNNQPEGISEYRNLSPVENPRENPVEDFYMATYAAIQRANTAIYYSDKTEPTNVLDQRRGEVKFLRALYYFMLVQQFGDVAIVKERISEPITEFERDPAEQVYQFIIKELEEALAQVPQNPSETGRVSKAAVLHYLAKVHLTRGYEPFGSQADFAKSAQYAEAVIAMKGGLTTPFEQLFFPGNENNPEILFSVQYSSSSIVDPREDGHMQNLFFGPYLGGEGATQGYPYRSNTLVPTMFLFDLFTENDARFDATFMTTIYNRYYDYYERSNERDKLKVATYFAPKWVEDLEGWRAADPENRAEAVIVPYPLGWEAGPNSQDGSSPGIKKFDDPKAAFSNNGSSTRDIFLARLAETYLIAAEAHFKLGQMAEAVALINAVRLRAAKPGAEEAMMISQADLDIDFILDERGRELAGEYHRWFDLKRTGTLVDRTARYNRDIKQWFDTGINPFEGKSGALKILRPIPQRAIDLNKAKIQQNPGY